MVLYSLRIIDRSFEHFKKKKKFKKLKRKQFLKNLQLPCDMKPVFAPGFAASYINPIAVRDIIRTRVCVLARSTTAIAALRLVQLAY